MKRFTHLSFKLIAAVTALAFTLTLANIGGVIAAVWTDQADYAPGSVVTISGDNSDNAGYLPGETVHVDVTGPNGYTATCDATVFESGEWSCQVTLWDSDLAVGTYSYTATGQTSGVSQNGTFTDEVTSSPASPPARQRPIRSLRARLSVREPLALVAHSPRVVNSNGGLQALTQTQQRPRVRRSLRPLPQMCQINLV